MKSVRARKPGHFERGSGERVGDAAIGDERPLAVAGYQRDEAWRGAGHGDGVDRHLSLAMRGDEPLAERIRADGAHERRLATECDEGATRVASGSAEAKPDGAGRVRAGLSCRGRAHDHVEHQVANAYKSRLLHGAAAD